MEEKPEKSGSAQRHCDIVVMQELTFPKALTWEQIERQKGCPQPYTDSALEVVMFYRKVMSKGVVNLCLKQNEESRSCNCFPLTPPKPRQNMTLFLKHLMVIYFDKCNNTTLICLFSLHSQ